jgi:hypothetical protein
LQTRQEPVEHNGAEPLATPPAEVDLTNR